MSTVVTHLFLFTKCAPIFHTEIYLHLFAVSNVVESHGFGHDGEVGAEELISQRRGVRGIAALETLLVRQRRRKCRKNSLMMVQIEIWSRILKEEHMDLQKKHRIAKSFIHSCYTIFEKSCLRWIPFCCVHLSQASVTSVAGCPECQVQKASAVRQSTSSTSSATLGRPLELEGHPGA